MKRVPVFVVVLTLFLLVAVPVALAYTSASGQVNDGNGNPWTYGGTISCVQNSTQAVIGSGTINPDGSWSVTLGSPAAATCTIDPAAGPNGDPGPTTCAIPGGGGGGVQNYACEPVNTGTGPNAISLASFSVGSLSLGWLLAPAGALGAALFFALRRRYS